jgi:integrase/recombinase XerD
VVEDTEGVGFRLGQFRDHLGFERGLSPRTLDAYERDLGRLIEFLAGRGVRSARAVDAGDLRAFVYHLKDRGLEATSIRRALSAIRTYFRFLLAEGEIVLDPTERVELPRAWRRLPHALGRADIERLLDAPDPAERLYWRDKALLEFAYATGVRVSELIGLKARDLDLEEGFALVLGKGSKERVVPVGRGAVAALTVYLRETRPALARGRAAPAVFLNARGGALSRMGVW